MQDVGFQAQTQHVPNTLTQCLSQKLELWKLINFASNWNSISQQSSSPAVKGWALWLQRNQWSLSRTESILMIPSGWQTFYRNIVLINQTSSIPTRGQTIAQETHALLCLRSCRLSASRAAWRWRAQASAPARAPPWAQLAACGPAVGWCWMEITLSKRSRGSHSAEPQHERILAPIVGNIYF